MTQPSSDLAIRPVDGELQCGAKAASCVCILPPHEPNTAHECDLATCGGSWRYDADGQFEPVRWPTPGGYATEEQS